MSRSDWEAKEARTNKNILLQVAFKAAVEWLNNRNAGTDEVQNLTLEWHRWLLSQTEGQKAAPVFHASPIDSLDDIPFGDNEAIQ